MDFNIDNFFDYSDISHEIDSSAPPDSSVTRDILLSESSVTVDPQNHLQLPFLELTKSFTNSTHSLSLSNESSARTPIKWQPFRISNSLLFCYSLSAI